MSTERVDVTKSVAQEFMAELKSAAEGFKVGTTITQQGASRRDTSESGTKEGSKLEFGHVSRDNASLQPTISSGVTKRMELFHTESFGHTISVLTVDTADEAVALGNDTEYGLTTSTFSRNVPKAIKFARHIESGACHINAMTIHDEPYLPYGGGKGSGFR